MIELAFNTEILNFIADNRTDLLTHFFQFFTFLGEVEGYVIVIAIIYTTYDKSLAFRLSVLVLITMSVNHLLKTILANPRPFINEGSYTEKWAVTSSKAQELATEFSTPSGHAMSVSAFYAFLYSSIQNKYVRIIAIAIIILSGLSRPYLGVHFFEDVLLGWILGIVMFFIAWRYSNQISKFWSDLSYRNQVLSMIGLSAILWTSTFVLNGSDIENHPLPFVGYIGFLTGVIIAYPLEVKNVGFNPKSASFPVKILRCIFMIFMVALPLTFLDYLFDSIIEEATFLAHFIQYVGYIIAALTGMFIAPLLFVRIKLGGQLNLG